MVFVRSAHRNLFRGGAYFFPCGEHKNHLGLKTPEYHRFYCSSGVGVEITEPPPSPKYASSFCVGVCVMPVYLWVAVWPAVGTKSKSAKWQQKLDSYRKKDLIILSTKSLVFHKKMLIFHKKSLTFNTKLLISQSSNLCCQISDFCCVWAIFLIRNS